MLVCGAIPREYLHHLPGKAHRCTGDAAMGPFSWRRPKSKRARDMAKKPVWIVSWLPVTGGGVIGGKFVPPPAKQRQFKDQKSAVNFVMRLDEGLQATARIFIPGGPAVELPVIKQMHAAQTSGDDE
jgi:hypothetical protein